jgi:hypothetical protein
VKYKFKIPKYICKNLITEEFNDFFVDQFYKLDPIEIKFETTTQDYGYEKYVKNLYENIIRRFEVENNYDNLIFNYKKFKQFYSVQFRWGIYEDFCDYLIKIGKKEEAFEEWVLLQEEEWEGWNRDFSYRDSAIRRLMDFEVIFKRGIIKGYHLYKIAEKGNQLTAFGRRNIKEVFITLDLILKNSLKNNFFEQFFSNYNFKRINKLKSLPFENYEIFFNHNKKSEKSWEWIIENKKIYILKDGRASLDTVYMSIKEEASRLLRESENVYRVNIGAKKIGESWIAETELYYKIKTSFPNNEVIQHGKPKWLGRQHFDVWIPDLKVAIEYQGKQHDEPIEFFGGIIAFEKGLKRDELKKEKCKINQIKLIEVRQGYFLDDLIKEIYK